MLPPARFGRHKPQAQRIVMGQQRANRLLQVLPIQPLRHRQEKRLVPMVRLAQLLLEEPALDGRDRNRSLNHSLFRLYAPAPVGHRRQPCHRRRLEDLSGSQPQPGLVCPGDDLDAEDRVTPQLEETVVHPHPIDPQHL